MITLLILFGLFCLASWLLYLRRVLLAWTLTLAVGFLVWTLCGIASPVWFTLLLLPYVAAVFVLGVPGIRRRLVTRRLMPLIEPMLPKLSATERAALDAGTVWWEAELFSGAPAWKQLLEYPVNGPTPADQAFIDGPCRELCRMLDDWQIHQEGDLSDEVWAYLKRERFFGMIIPEEYGGLGLSAQANSAVVTMISSRSGVAAVTVMVPNSLGPAELLLHYGTQEQRAHWLPRLATGEEVPCFALTEPTAGSDAGSIKSRAVVCRGEYEGREVLGMRLTWEKRYITLSAVATVIGLAFKLYDPDALLGDKPELGITCALIPAHLPGVETGERHDPMGVPFVNGTTRGVDVFVPLDHIIGGVELAGQGWRMLMDCLAAGRGISLPALSVGASELTTRVVGAYASIREQFGLSIGRFGGIEECLARIAGTTYVLDATRRLTAAAIDGGQKPAVVSAIAKAYTTEGMRRVITQGMDVMAGAAISRGPRNMLAHLYQAATIGITVEGANVLTRSMIIFGQGAIRCHTWALEEIEAAAAGSLERFDRALFGHLGLVASNWARGAILGLSNGCWAPRPVKGPVGRYFGALERLSAAYAIVVEATMVTLGSAVKREEKITGRLADALAWLYMGSAALKRYVDEGQTPRDLPLVRWSCETALNEVEGALLGVLRNLPNRPVAFLLRVKLFPFWARQHGPSDLLGGEVARAILDGGEAREHLTQDVYVPEGDGPGLGKLEHALAKVVAARAPHRRVLEAIRSGALPRGPVLERLEAATLQHVISADEARLIRDADAARLDAVQVDVFGGRPPKAPANEAPTAPSPS